jgi:hypothetical protein
MQVRANATRLNRLVRSRSHWTGKLRPQNAAELLALENDLGIQAGSFAGRDRSFAEAIAIA